jgi:hypothetical protein
LTDRRGVQFRYFLGGSNLIEGLARYGHPGR